jgi:predicted DNA-binding transcriptional regulator
MAGEPQKDSSQRLDDSLKGTTLRVYRYMLKNGKPLGITDIQKALGLSSPSVAQYHIQKLLRLGLVREEQPGYVVDKVVFENVIRIRRVSIPIQTAYVAFFGAALFILLVFLRPATIDSVYFFALVVNLAALAIALYETVKTRRRI